MNAGIREGIEFLLMTAFFSVALFIYNLLLGEGVCTGALNNGLPDCSVSSRVQYFKSQPAILAVNIIGMLIAGSFLAMLSSVFIRYHRENKKD